MAELEADAGDDEVFEQVRASLRRFVCPHHLSCSHVFGEAQEVDEAVNPDAGFGAMAAEMDVDSDDGLFLPHPFLLIRFVERPGTEVGRYRT